METKATIQFKESIRGKVGIVENKHYQQVPPPSQLTQREKDQIIKIRDKIDTIDDSHKVCKVIGNT